jgi:hypothetical protein
MDEKAREARRIYKREWNRRNPDKVKASQKRYWEKKSRGSGGERDRRNRERGIT